MITKYSEGCFRLYGRALSLEDMSTLVEEARNTELKRARICVHYDENDAIQEMFVLLLKETYKGTYKYRRANSILLLNGAMNIEFLSQRGEILNTFSIDKDRPFIKIEAGVYHRPTILSDYVLLHEVHQGPFAPNEFMKMMEPRGG